MNKRSQINKWVFSFFSFFVLLFFMAGMISFMHFSEYYTPNMFTDDERVAYINISDEITDIEEIVDLIVEEVNVKDEKSLRKAIRKLDYNTPKAGHYEVSHGMTNLDLIRVLQRGLQTPVNVKFNNIRTKEQLAESLSKQLMPDKEEILALLNDTAYLDDYNLNPDNVVSVFIPNTYEFYWNVTAEKLFERMYYEYKKFWNEERLQKAAEIPLTPAEVYILASIVEEETKKSHEFPVVAGLYINRLKQNMALQADPTVKFAVGDFSLRRILNVHLKTDSPYNTYKNKGLPPGPIRTPSVEVIDAVLDYEKHDYIFMAAKETFNGEHNFAKTLAEHNKNANKYRKALNKRGIYK